MRSGFSTIEDVGRRSVACLLVSAGVIAVTPFSLGAKAPQPPPRLWPVRSPVRGVAAGAGGLAGKAPPRKAAPAKKGLPPGRFVAAAPPAPIVFAPRTQQNPADPREQGISKMREQVADLLRGGTLGR